MCNKHRREKIGLVDQFIMAYGIISNFLFI